MNQPPRVALLIETTSSWGCDLIRGIAEYARSQGGWQLSWKEGSPRELSQTPTGWSGEGIIARILSPQLAQSLAKTNLPVVNLAAYQFDTCSALRCCYDERQAVSTALEYFSHRGYRQFAFYSSGMCKPSEDLFASAFCEFAQKTGRNCFRLERELPEAANWEYQREKVGRWLNSLPKPLAVVTGTDQLGRQLLEACRFSGLAVPNQVAVLCLEGDELSSEIEETPLSTLSVSPRKLGWESARLLCEWMRQPHRPPEPLFLPVTQVITRRSTEMLAVDDPLLGKAINYIHQHFRKPIQVSDVLKQIPLSRRMLEQRFQTVLGRSPAAEIRRLRLDYAKRLLIDSDLLIGQIAVESGFERAEVLARVFRRELEMTPSEYRQQARKS